MEMLAEVSSVPKISGFSKSLGQSYSFQFLVEISGIRP